MVARDNSTLAFSTKLLNYIIAFAIQGKSGHYKIFDAWLRGFLFATLIKICCKVLNRVKVPRDSLLIHDCRVTYENCYKSSGFFSI